MGYLEPLKEEIRKLEKQADLKEGETVCLHYWACCAFSNFIKMYEQAVQNGTKVVEIRQGRQDEFVAQANTTVNQYRVWLAISKK